MGVLSPVRRWKRQAQRRWQSFRNESNVTSIARTRRRQRKGSNPQVLIGPANSAGQAAAWARALKADGVAAHSLRIAADDDPSWYISDLRLERARWRTYQGRLALASKIAESYDAVLLESLRPLFAIRAEHDFSAQRAREDLRLLKHCKIKTALVFHGSDIRDTAAHALREEFSPYRNPADPQILQRLQARAKETRTVARELGSAGHPLFVTTPDLFLELPSAKWLPITIDYELFAAAGRMTPAFIHEDPLRILFQPSRGWLKSHEMVELVLRNLEREGVIQLVPNDPVEHVRMPERITSADVVIDRFDGITGVLTAEALAAGRVVIANVAPWAHERAEAIAPVHHATLETLEETLRALAADRGSSQEALDSGREFVRTWHDGRMSAERIRQALRIG